MAKLKLNDPFIRSHPAPDKRTEVYDENTPGLALRITPTGHKSFVYRYRFNDTVKRYTIGSYGSISLAMARDKAKELSYKVSIGIDPLEEKKARKRQPEKHTVRDLAELYKKRHFPTLKESTRRTYRSRIDSEILPTLGDVPLEDLHRSDIISLLEEIVYEEGKHAHANRVRSVLSGMLNFGIQRGLTDHNPVSTVKPIGQEQSRKRVYDEDEIRALWEAFEEQAEPVQSVLKMLLTTGQRKGETCRMEWANIEDNVWTIPEEVTKNGRRHFVPLSEMALNIIENVRPLTGNSEYVFESQKNRGEPVRWLGDVPTRIRDLSGVSDFRMHDLRRTAASGMARLGIDRTVLGKVLNHKGLSGDSQVTAIYDRYQYMDEKREALSRWSHKLEQIIEGKEANVTQMKSA